MTEARVSTKGQIVVPVEVRKRHGWEPGTKIVIEETDDGLVLRTIDELIKATRGMFKNTGGKSMTEELLEDRAEDLRIEERQYRRHLRHGRAKKAH